MNNAESNKPRQKSRIAIHASHINNILLVFVLVLMTVISAVIINGIGHNNARDIVHAYSIEAAQAFYSYINENLILVRKASSSKAVTDWFTDERDRVKKVIAFNEIMDYTKVLRDVHLYFGINESKNEYTIKGKTTFERFVSFDRLDPSKIEDTWYFKCISSENEYTLNIDAEKFTQARRLWINHKVMVDGNFAGVFCSGLRIPNVFQKIFDKYETNKVRGYVIDKNGVIQSDSAAYGIYNEESTSHIREENTDPAFVAALASYLGNIDGFFGDHSYPEIVKLVRGPYKYAAIGPIDKTDWSIVVFYNPNTFSSVTGFLPCLIVMLVTLLSYVISRNILMNRFVYAPLNRLTRSVSEGAPTDTGFFGDNRDDEIGELARTIRDVIREQQRQKELLYAVNSAATILLVPTNEKDVRTSFLLGMEIIGSCVDVDRIHIWQNETIGGIFYYVNKVRWLRKEGQWKQSASLKRPYKEMPEWERKFSLNEYVNGPVSAMMQQERDILESQGIKSILAIPLYMQSQFWGYFSFDDCHRERIFTEDEIEILRSAGLMIVSAMNRDIQAAKFREAHEYTQVLLDAMPLSTNLWDKHLNIIDCNDENKKLFKISDKKEFFNHFFDFSPEYQSDEQLSFEKANAYINKAFEEGRCVFEWMHQMADGTPIPTEVTLVRIRLGEEYFVAGYIQDLREYKQMLTEIEQRDNLLHAVNRAAEVMLSTEDEENIEDSLQKGMELMGRCVEVDRVQIWQNEMIDDELYAILKYEWLSDYGRQTIPIPANLKFSYNAVPGWQDRFSNNKYINGPLSSLSPEEQNFLSPYGIASIIIIPLFLQNQFWGFFSIDDCRRDRTFTEDEIDILTSGSLMMISVVNRNEQTKQLRQAHEHTQVLLDAMPMACHLWDRNGKMLDCNEEMVKLFETKDKNDCISRFWELSLEYQPNGQLSTEIGKNNLKKAFDEGRCVFEWMHQMSDGTPVPAEVTLVRVRFGEEDVVAAYARDLREYKQIMKEIDRRNYLQNTVNNVAAFLLQSEIDEYKRGLYHCMYILANAIDADRVYIWKNHIKDGQLYCTQLFAWSEGADLQQDNEFAVDISYNERIPGWEETLSRGECINALVRNMSPQERAHLSPQGIMSIFVVPVFVRNEFWGFVGYDDCHQERVFSQNEQSILRTASMLIASSWLRHDALLNIRATADKLEAVIANYAGIIWCVDQNSIITLFNGRYLNMLDLKPEFFEGKKLMDALQEKQFFSIREIVQKTFIEGSQDWTLEIDDKTYRIRTQPIYDNSDNIVNIMGAFDDVSERTRLQIELKAALKEAQQANSAKSSFLANMSHEMRTPLNAIIGLSELTIEVYDLNENVRVNFEKINNAGTNLLSMVNDILDISKVEAGRFALVPVEYDVPSLINDAVVQSIVHIGNKPIKFILDIDENIPASLFGDDLRIKQVLNNLLSNAFKYTEEGIVKLDISCERDGETIWVIVRVSDTGIGIRSENMESLFSNYAMVDSKSNRKVEGTGLGLAISKNLVEMMDGYIAVESEYGRGSVFTVKIKQQFTTDAKIGAEIINSLKNFHYSDHKRLRNSRMVKINMPYVRVLLVDDVVTNLDVTKGMMKLYGMQIDCVTSGYEAIDAVREERVRYDAIFMDHMMPKLDGIETTRIIREEIGTEYAKTVPIIALTANAIMGNEEMFLNKGFQAFISKPIDVMHLDSILYTWIVSKQSEETLLKAEKERVELHAKTTNKNLKNDLNILKNAFVEGIDFIQVMERFSGEEAYLDVLRSYYLQTPNLLKKLQTFGSDKLLSTEIEGIPLHEYGVIIHGLKGSSYSICADVVGQEAEKLEEAAKTGDIEFMMTRNASFISMVESLLLDLGVLLQSITNCVETKKEASAPDIDLLSRLLEAAKRYKAVAMEQIMSELEYYKYESGGDLVVWLREQINNLEYDAICARLESFI